MSGSGQAMRVVINGPMTRLVADSPALTVPWKRLQPVDPETLPEPKAKGRLPWQCFPRLAVQLAQHPRRTVKNGERSGPGHFGVGLDELAALNAECPGRQLPRAAHAVIGPGLQDVEHDGFAVDARRADLHAVTDQADRLLHDLSILAAHDRQIPEVARAAAAVGEMHDRLVGAVLVEIAGEMETFGEPDCRHRGATLHQGLALPFAGAERDGTRVLDTRVGCAGQFPRGRRRSRGGRLLRPAIPSSMLGCAGPGGCKCDGSGGDEGEKLVSHFCSLQIKVQVRGHS